MKSQFSSLFWMVILGGSCLLPSFTFQYTSQFTSTPPNYKVVFPDNKVNTIEIQLGKANWDSIKADLKAKLGTDFGKGMGLRKRPPFPMDSSMRHFSATPPKSPNPERMRQVPLKMIEINPIYVMTSIKFNGVQKDHVAFRLKGNSSLTSAWVQGVFKLPFRLAFDHIDLPGTSERGSLYGFHELTFSPGFSDLSLLREKLSTDLFRLAGVPAAHTAFYKILIDFGDGPQYCGIYTAVEVIEDTMVSSQWGVTSGNIYKPESSLTTFSVQEFEKKNNKKAKDYADVRNFINALHDSSRLSDPSAWRSKLEQTFDVYHFLNYLAVNNVIVNWDTYGSMPHNYYLYNSPTKHLTWIPWDHNMALSDGMKGPKAPPGFMPPPNQGGVPPNGFAPPMGGMGQTVALNLSNVSSHWPLIKFLAEDPVYFAAYRQYVKEFTEKVFTPTQMEAMLMHDHQLILPFVNGKLKEQKPYSFLVQPSDFEKDFENLRAFVMARRTAVKKFLESKQTRSPF
ncbi:MAG: CotH kinase family protein [Spirosomataceae bacterium]